MDKQTKAEISKRLREIADLLEKPNQLITDAAPVTYQIGTCCCHLFVSGQITGGWVCPVHGRQL